MQTVEIKAKKTGEEPITQEVELPESLSEAVDMWGEEEVFGLAKQQKVIRIQATMRRPAGGEKAKELYNRLVDTGKLGEEQCRQISGYAGSSNDSGS